MKQKDVSTSINIIDNQALITNSIFHIPNLIKNIIPLTIVRVCNEDDKYCVCSLF